MNDIFIDENEDIWIGVNTSIMFVDDSWKIDKKEDKGIECDTDKEQEI